MRYLIFIIFTVFLITSVIVGIQGHKIVSFVDLLICIWAIRLVIVSGRQGGMNEEECYEKLYGERHCPLQKSQADLQADFVENGVGNALNK